FSGNERANYIYKYYGEDLDKLTDGVMTRRISYEVERRIIKPFSEREVRLSYISLNNWVSWICSNVMTIAANMIDFEPKRLQIVTRCLSYIDRLVYTYGEDGGCNEGANYWTAAICPLYDACEMLYDMTNGKINVYDSEFLKKACHFIVDMCIDEKKQMFYNFADGGVVIKIDGDEIYRMGVNLKDDAILTLADAIRPNKKGDGFKPYINYFYPYNAIKNLYVYPTVEYTKKSSDGDVYKDLQVSTYKTKDFSIAIKGGHNRESHNHNDVGSFMVYKKDQPIFIDVGPMEYTKDTFNDNRYTIWVNQSSYHNIPDICGNMQSPGRDFFAKSFVRDGNTTTVEYADAYLNKADISRCERKLKVNDSAIEIEDHVDVNGDVTFRFMTKFEPKLDGNKVQIDDVKVTFDGAQKIDVETINLTSNRLKLAWDTDKLYRISIVSHNLKTTIEA
ncbi:MAG: heparinase II/III-family protein, partial [Clostridia bacterium]|nr:heparinase II/III-family protein [Clostridia bacterium]